MNRSASAIWHKGLKDGDGSISTDSGALDEVAYGFGSRFKDERGTNPEELLAAAHAACFAMAFSKELEDRGVEPELVRTKVDISLEKTNETFEITSSAIEVNKLYCAEAVDDETIQEAAEHAKSQCPVSSMMSIPIELTVKG